MTDITGVKLTDAALAPHFKSRTLAEFVASMEKEDMARRFLDIISNGDEYVVRMDYKGVKEVGKFNYTYDMEFNMQKVVRCRDCKEYRPELYKNISCELLARYVEPDDFCAWGERHAD